MKTPLQESPYGLIQEKYRSDSYKLFVCCMCLNLTNIKQVRPVVEELFKKYPDAAAMAKADQAELVEIVRTLGFYNRRSAGLIKMAKAFISGWSRADELPGIGKYAADSHRMFVEGMLDVEPQDKELKKYKKWAETLDGN